MREDKNQQDIVIDSVFFAQTHIMEPNVIPISSSPAADTR
jgi:hypothetical protein